MKENLNISFFIPSVAGGGAERVTLNLAKGFIKRGVNVHLVIADYSGALVSEIPAGCRVVNLQSRRVLFSIFKLVRYLRENKPLALVSALDHANVVSVLAKVLSGSRNTKLILVVHTTFSAAIRRSKNCRTKILPLLMYLTYWKAEHVVAVSDGVADDLCKSIPYLKTKIRVLYNPIVLPEIFDRAKDRVEHPWFNADIPVIVSVGRLSKEKDYGTLLMAFSLLIKKTPAHLVILGEGKERENIEKISRELNIEDFVWMPGFVENPYKYMKNSSVFVLSSMYEGLPTVLVEALALGIQVVSTDCQSGPREILEDGRFGMLVPTGDFKALANALEQVLAGSVRFPAEEFDSRKYSLENCTESYYDLIFRGRERA